MAGGVTFLLSLNRATHDPKRSRVSLYNICKNMKNTLYLQGVSYIFLAFCPLWGAAGAFETWLFAFFFAVVAGEEAVLF